VVVVVLAAGAYAGLKRNARRAAIPEIAAGKGLRFSETDQFGSTTVAFPLFREGDGRAVESVMWLDGDTKVDGGMPTHVFDYGFYRIHHDRSGNETKSWHWFSCAMTQVAASLPELRVAHKDVVGEVLEHLGGEPITFESSEFDDTFRVTSPDRRFATAFIDAQMMQLLLETKGALALETRGRFVLLAGTQVKPDELPILLGVTDELVRRIPAAVYALYPPVGPSPDDPVPPAAGPVGPAPVDDASDPDAWDPTPGVDYDLDGHPVTPHTEDPWHDHAVRPHDPRPPDRSL
jgi:hypothetical protein